MNKQFVLLLILIAATPNLLIAECACSIIPKPSVPEFTLKLEAHPYDVPPTYKIDQYTGKNVTDKAGYHVENKSIVITIKNQAFTPSFNGTNYYMAYDVRVKAHFGEVWDELYPQRECTMSKYLSEDFPKASNSEYTILSVSAKKYPPDAKVDFQVQAILGHDSQVYVLEYIPDHPLAGAVGGHYEQGIVFDTASDWSETQTIKISASDSTTNSETPEQTETEPTQQDTEPEIQQPDQFTTILSEALIVITVATSLGLVIYLIKRKQKH